MTKRYIQKYLPVFAALTLAFPCAGFGQDAGKTPTPSTTPALPAASESVDRIVENFYGLLTKGQVDEAYDFLTKGTRIADDLPRMASLKGRTKDAIKLFGDIQGFELVSIQNSGTHLMRATYISLGKTAPLRWRFLFYRLDKTWKLIDLGVDDRLSDLFDDNKPQPQQESGAAP